MRGKVVTWVLHFALWFTQLVAGLMVLIGALVLGMLGPVAYMLWTGQVQPGERFFVDGVAPTNAQVVIELLLGCSFIALGMWLGRWASKMRGTVLKRQST